MPDPLTDAARWQAWAAAYVALCQRVVDEATDQPGRHAASSSETLSSYLDLLAKMGALEPDRFTGVLLIPEGACGTCGRTAGVTPGCAECAARCQVLA